MKNISHDCGNTSSKYSLLVKYPTGPEYLNMEQVLVLHPLICLSY